MYRSEDVREVIRIAVQRGNDSAAWNSGMDRKQIVEEAEALLEDMVPVEPDYEAMSNLMVQKIDVAAWWTDSNREKLARELWDAGIGGDDE